MDSSATATATASGPPRSVLITGTVGVGKTSVASAAGELLAAAGTPHAVIDLDWLRRCWPAPPGDRFNSAMTLRNLRDMARNYREAGAEWLLLAGVIESRAERADYARTLGGPLTVCRLHAELPVVHERLHARHLPGSAELHWHLHRAGELAAILDAADPADTSVAADGPLPEVAAAVLRAAGAPGATAQAPPDNAGTGNAGTGNAGPAQAEGMP